MHPGKLIGSARLRSRKPSKSKRGMAIVVALLVVSVVATLSMIYLQLSLSKNKEQRESVDSKRAFYMAEAGLSEAFIGLCVGQSGEVGSKDHPACFANGLFFVTAKEETENRITLESTGLCGAGRATLSIVVERKADTIGGLGFFGDQSMLIEAGAVIDSYDSRTGAYDPLAHVLPIGGQLPTGARVGCNGDIEITGQGAGAKIYGDARPGPNGTLYRARNATISGSTAPNTAIVPFPEITVPSVPNYGNYTSQLLGPTLVTLPTNQGYGTFRLRTGTKATLVGPATVVVDKLVVETGATLELDGRNGPIQLVVKQGMKTNALSTVKTLGDDPRTAAIEIAGTTAVDVDGDGALDQPATIGSQGNYYGTIYAPHADVNIPALFSIYGGVSARKLTMRSGAKLHYDQALAQTSAAETGTPHFLGWRIVELPNVPLVSLRFDALRSLTEQGIVPLPGKLAHHAVGVLAH